MYEKLASEVTAIIHVAWTINFQMQLRSLAKDNINGVRSLVDLVLHTVPPRFAFCSSTAGVANCPLQEEIPERILGETSLTFFRLLRVLNELLSKFTSARMKARVYTLALLFFVWASCPEIQSGGFGMPKERGR